MSKIKWKVSGAPTGHYRSFMARSWPSGYINGDQYAFAFRCEDDYTPARARGEQPHAPIKVTICDYRQSMQNGQGAWKVRTLVGEHATLEAAKAAAQTFLDAHPEFFIKPAKE